MKKRTAAAAAVITIIIAIVLLALFFNGTVRLNSPADYPVRGVDVSHYQGDIDWEVLAEQGIDFAFIKATEGSSHTDENFGINMEGALKTKLRVGAYHFFSFESPGRTQAQNYINAVGKGEGLLPPVVDFEFYGDIDERLPDREETLAEIKALISELRGYYGKRPIIYTTARVYDMYVAGDFEDCDIWIRSVYTKPTLSDERDWTFWQYTDRETLEGYSGDERFIDMNVFNGTKRQFKRYGK